MKKFLFLVISLLSVSYEINCFKYINNRTVTPSTILTGDAATSVDYNILNAGNGDFSKHKRFFGIHNMCLEISGYEPVYLIKDDVCLYPRLFTLLSHFLSDDNMFVQRWACVKWVYPLSFGFSISHDKLTITSAIYKYKIVAPLCATKTIDLIKKSDSDVVCADSDLTVKVTVNGRTVQVAQKTALQIYSKSAKSVFNSVVVVPVAVGTLMATLTMLVVLAGIVGSSLKI